MPEVRKASYQRKSGRLAWYRNGLPSLHGGSHGGYWVMSYHLLGLGHLQGHLLGHDSAFTGSFMLFGPGRGPSGGR